jgi:hypothetical protein
VSSTQRSVEDWLDNLCDVWKSITLENGTKLKSYRVFSPNELPSAPIMAVNAPCVASYVDDCEVQISESGHNVLGWYGISEFHITKDVKPSNYREVMLFYRKILAAAFASYMLTNVATGSGGNGGHFTILQNTQGAMRFTQFLNPATGVPDHQGIVVRWYVHQNVGAGYPLS